MSDALPPHAVRRLLAAAGEPEASEPGRAPAARIDPRYRLIRELGRGGMGVVYEAEDLELKRRVALKVLPDGEESAELRARFAREAQSAACLAHPNIAAVHDATPRWISMQLVEGRPLSEVPRGERRRIVALVRDAARAVQHAHDHGIVHRDLKPSNLLVAGDHVWIVDFGLAKSAADDASISVSGSILGTPAFMAPEQAAGRQDRVDARTDVYGLGATLYSCLAGRPPFVERELVRLLRAVVESDPPPPRLERDLDVIVLKCLAKEPSERFGSAADLADELDRWLDGRPIRARPPTLAYRTRKLVTRHRRLLRVAAAAVFVTGLVLVPWTLRERAAGAGASAALELGMRVSALLNNAESLRRDGKMGIANERLEQGIRACDDFLALHDVARGHQLRGRVLRARGRSDAARAAFDRALALDPKLVGVRFERGLLLVAVDPDQALADLSELADANAEELGLREVDRRFGESVRARLRGDFIQERKHLKEVLQVDPTHLEATLALANLALQDHQDDEALDLAIGAVSLQRPPAVDVGAVPRR